jgi:hypothetical protein
VSQVSAACFKNDRKPILEASVAAESASDTRVSWQTGIPKHERNRFDSYSLRADWPFAKALERIPLTLAENSGLDQVDILARLRAEHQKGHVWMGVDSFSGSVKDMRLLDVVEPVAVKKHLLSSATEAASMVIKIDDVIGLVRNIEQIENKFLKDNPLQLPIIYRKFLNMEFHGTEHLFAKMDSQMVFTLLWLTVNVTRGYIINFNPILSAFLAAIVTAARSMSTPTTLVAPKRAAPRANRPVPQPRSRTLLSMTSSFAYVAR